MFEQQDSESSDIRTVMESMPVGYAEINRDMSFRYTNTALQHALDYSGDALIDMSLTDISADEEKARQIFSLVIKGDEPGEEYFVFRKKDGTYMYVLARSAPIRESGTVNGVRAIFIDKTEQVLVEHSLRASEKRFREIFESLPVGYCEISTGRRITYMNDELHRMSGFDEDDVQTGVPLSMVTTELEKMENNFQRALRGERKEPEHYQLLRKDGSTYFSLIRSTPMFEDGNAAGVRSIVVDITPRVETEKQLKANLREKEILLNDIHHRVKNNLQIIGSLIDLQAEEMGGSGHVLSQFQNTQDRIKAMALIHENLYQSHDLSRINMKEYISSIVGYIRQVYTAEAGTGGITIRSELDDLSLPVNTAIPCGLIITELLSNACKHAFPEGREGLIHAGFTTDSSGDFLLEISDNGIGYQDLEHFSTTETMGLQLVNMFTKQIRGTITVSVTEGTTIRLTFPEPGPS